MLAGPALIVLSVTTGHTGSSTTTSTPPSPPLSALSSRQASLMLRRTVASGDVLTTNLLVMSDQGRGTGL